MNSSNSSTGPSSASSSQPLNSDSSESSNFPEEIQELVEIAQETPSNIEDVNNSESSCDDPEDVIAPKVDCAAPKRGLLLRTPDIRDFNYRPIPRRAASHIRKKFWATNYAFDQGETSACVGYSGAAFLDSAPVRNRMEDAPFKPFDLYVLAKRFDEWPGEDYEGTSIRGLCKALKAAGIIAKYEWAFDTRSITRWLLTDGPVIVGTVWSDEMFETDKKGFIHPGVGASNPHSGGHAYLLKGVDLDKKCPDGTKGAYKILNSWGKSWGTNGTAWIAISEFEGLLRLSGEAVRMRENKVF
jgi:C1A family cysteine protease